MNDDIGKKFEPSNFWEVAYDRPLDKQELDEIHGNATAFVKFMSIEQLEQKRREH